MENCVGLPREPLPRPVVNAVRPVSILCLNVVIAANAMMTLPSGAAFLIAGMQMASVSIPSCTQGATPSSTVIL